MDINTIGSFIGTVGFPIMACIALFYQNMKLIEAHKKESDDIVKALNNNTLVISQLCDKLGVEYESNT